MAVADCCGLLESKTLTVKFEVPVVVGVPVMAPLPAFKLKPAGSVPALMLQVYGCTPPLACRNAFRYGVFTTPAGSPLVVTCSGALLLTVILRFADAVCAVGVSESVTFTVKDEVPVAVGVPLITPVEALSDSPAGRLPEVTCQE